LKVEREMRRRNSNVSLSSHSSFSKRRMKDDSLDHPKIIGDSTHSIVRICLTGGPCAGKTTALSTLSQHLTLMGFKVLMVPEAATLLMKGGAMIETRSMTFSDAVKF
jgi:putative protein kinase ArgK-like GTPase of G3E family